MMIVQAREEVRREVVEQKIFFSFFVMHVWILKLDQTFSYFLEKVGENKGVLGIAGCGLRTAVASRPDYGVQSKGCLPLPKALPSVRLAVLTQGVTPATVEDEEDSQDEDADTGDPDAPPTTTPQIITIPAPGDWSSSPSTTSSKPNSGIYM